MATYRVIAWKDIPASVEAHDGGDQVTLQLSERFQMLIDSVAMQLGVHDEDAYLEHWGATDGERAGTAREVGSAVWQVFDGAGSVRLNDSEHPLERGDIIAVPAWTEFSLTADGQLDLFTFSDAPVFEKLNLLRTELI